MRSGSKTKSRPKLLKRRNQLVELLRCYTYILRTSTFDGVQNTKAHRADLIERIKNWNRELAEIDLQL